MRVRIWGTRGSIATPGAQTNRFGGNTSCIEIQTKDGALFILDCGTGARLLGEHLNKSQNKPINGTILISHAHWDHIQGFPFLAPIFAPENSFDVYGPKGGQQSLQQVLAVQMEFTYFPISLDQLSSSLSYHHLAEGTHDIGGVKIAAQYLHHPAVTLGYRIEVDGVSVLYLCDHEPFSELIWRSDGEPAQLESILHEGDLRHAKFMCNADLVIHDSQYTKEEYSVKKNWGHSYYEYVVGIASAAGVKKLLLTHHDPSHHDAFLEEMELSAQNLAESYGRPLEVACAYEGLELEVISENHPVTNVENQVSVHSTEQVTKILVADDDPDILMLVETVLNTEEFSVAVAVDGSETIRKVKELKPDLLILDLMMPELGGLEVLKILRAHPETADLPILMLTAKDDEEHIRMGFDNGADDYLTKPFKIPQLTSRVRACLARLDSSKTNQRLKRK